MRIFYGFAGTEKIIRPVVTVGSYDGVHRGHREILQHMGRLAHKMAGESVVITFDPHPRKVVPGGGEIFLINTLSEKICLLEAIGIDNLIVVHFTPEFSTTSYSDFVSDYLVGKLRIHTLVVGDNHRLGNKRSGDYAKLQHLSRLYGFDIFRLQQQEVEGARVSSTVVRKLLQEGRMDAAADYLGEPYFIMARLEKGRLNRIDPAKLLPPPGDYPVEMAAVNPEQYLECAILPTAIAAEIPAVCTILEGREVRLHPLRRHLHLENREIIVTFK